MSLLKSASLRTKDDRPAKHQPRDVRSEAAEGPALSVEPGVVNRGSASRQDARALLTEASCAASVDEMTRVVWEVQRVGTASGV